MRSCSIQAPLHNGIGGSKPICKQSAQKLQQANPGKLYKSPFSLEEWLQSMRPGSAWQAR